MADEFPKIGTKGLTPGAPIINPDGSKSTERTISVGFDEGVQLIPTIVVDDEGFLVKVTDEEAIRLFQLGKNPSRGRFDTEEEARKFAIRRSKEGGRFQTEVDRIVQKAKME